MKNSRGDTKRMKKTITSVSFSFPVVRRNPMQPSLSFSIIFFSLSLFSSLFRNGFDKGGESFLYSSPKIFLNHLINACMIVRGSLDQDLLITNWAFPFALNLDCRTVCRKSLVIKNYTKLLSPFCKQI